MVVGVLRIDLRLHQAQNLKQKRSVLSKLLNRLRSRFPVSVAEVGYQDLLQRAMLGASMTAGSEAQIQSVFLNLEDEINRSGLTELVSSELEYLHYGEELS